MSCLAFIRTVYSPSSLDHGAHPVLLLSHADSMITTWLQIFLFLVGRWYHARAQMSVIPSQFMFVSAFQAASAAKGLYTADSRSGKQIFIPRRRTYKANLFCFRSVRTGQCYDKYVCVYSMCWCSSFVKAKNRHVFLHKRFAESLTHSFKWGFERPGVQRRNSLLNIYLRNRLNVPLAGGLPSFVDVCWIPLHEQLAWGRTSLYSVFPRFTTSGEG